MMAQIIDRRRLKAEMKDVLRGAQVSPKAMTALYLLIVLAMDLADQFAAGDAVSVTDRNLLGIFVYVLVNLLGGLLGAGFVLYCMAVRRGERAEFLTLFDGFSFAGKVIGLTIVRSCFIMLWSMLFVIPGIVAAYRYRFALYDLCEDPDLSILDAIEMSKRQTRGYKSQLLLLDLSYLGWSALSILPILLHDSYIYSQLLLNEGAVFAVSMVPPLSLLGWVLVGGVWSTVVSMFYLPVYQCTELGYFEAAKQTSGVVPGSFSGKSGPDGLGGMDGPDYR